MAFTINEEQVVYGEALETHGLEVLGSTNIFGLLTFGLIWDDYRDIWSTTDQDGSATWSSAEQSVSTTWTPLIGGAWGEN